MMAVPPVSDCSRLPPAGSGSIADFISSFAYKGSSASPSPRARADDDRNRNRNRNSRGGTRSVSWSPGTSPVPPHGKGSSSSSVEEGQSNSKVYSKYFPLPPTASNPVPLHRHQIPGLQKFVNQGSSAVPSDSEPHKNITSTGLETEREAEAVADEGDDDKNKYQMSAVTKPKRRRRKQQKKNKNQTHGAALPDAQATVATATATTSNLDPPLYHQLQSPTNLTSPKLPKLNNQDSAVHHSLEMEMETETDTVADDGITHKQFATSQGPKKRQKQQQKKNQTPPDTRPTSFIRATVGGQTKILSKYFPLPPTASDIAPVPYRQLKLPANNKDKEKKKKPPAAAAAAATSSSSSPEQGTKKRPRIQKRHHLHQQQDSDNSIPADQQPQKIEENKPRSQASSYLSASEKKLDAYKRLIDVDDNTWKPPRSCYHLLQEDHFFDPWRVMLICILLNRTTGNQVRGVLPGLFLLCPNAEAATKVCEEDIERLIAPLGIQRKRARMIKRFSQEYLGEEWTHVTDLHGVGKYAADAYAIFCAGKPEAVIPNDHKLVDYWRFVCQVKGC